MQNKSWYCFDLITMDFTWKTSSWWQHISLYNSNICHHDNSTFTHMPVSYACCLLCCNPIPWQMFAFVSVADESLDAPFGGFLTRSNKVEMIEDFRRNPPTLPPLTITNSTVTAVESFRFLRTTISQNLKWVNHNLVSQKYVPLCTFCVTQFYIPYCTFRRSFKEKCPLSGAKTQVIYVNPGTFLICRYRYMLLCFYYVATETYCGGSEFKYPGSVLKS